MNKGIDMSNDDKHLLLHAALAVGLVIGSEWDCAESGILIGNGDGDLTVYNPLENDADAFRLMVDLEMHPQVYNKYTCVKIPQSKILSDCVDNDKRAATRRAITTAAAEIWRMRSDQT